MSLRARPMRPIDVAPCVQMIAEHRVIGPRYGPAVKDLRAAWLRLLESDALLTCVMEEVEGTKATTWGIGVSIFVQEDYFHGLKSQPLRWVGPDLAKRIARGESPHLSDKQVRDGNARDGLYSITWEGCVRSEFEPRTELFHFMVSAFLGLHCGYRFKEQLAPQAENAARMQWTFNAGGQLWDAAKGRYIDPAGKGLNALAREPHIMGITGEMERGRPGSWVGALFDYRPPRLGFSRAEQRLLIEAVGRESGTDEELARSLHVSLPTIKKAWLSIYRRVNEKQPQIIPVGGNSDSGKAERGKEKRRRLLLYVRQHPEELRPVNHRLLQQPMAHAKM
jgi:hypothetical protein